MNPLLKEALLKQKTKQRIKSAIQDSKINESTSLEEVDLHATFVEPFADVFRAIKLSTKDIVNSLTLALGSVLTLDPEKQKQRMQKYDERKQKIEGEWGPIMKKVDDSLSTGDADIVALAFAPGAYFAASLGTKAYNAASGVGSFLSDMGMKKGLMSLLPGVPSVSVQDDGAPSEDSKKGSIVDKLTLLFMGTSIAAAGAEAYQKKKAQEAQKEARHTNKGIISEQASGGFARDFRKFMDDVGLDAEFKKMQKQLYDHYEEIAKEQNDLYEPRKEIADKLTSLSSGPDTGSGFEDLSKIIDDLKSSKDRGLAAEGSKIEKDLKEKIEKLKTSEEFIETVKEETGKEEVTDDEIEKAASNAVFAKVKVTLADKMKKDIDALRQDILKFLEEQFPSKDTISMLSKSKEGLKLSKLIQDTLNTYTS
tara:strand:- start:48 stop:1316 length:1269 start_codon:yes stop_codon:yes gene_type:complete